MRTEAAPTWAARHLSESKRWVRQWWLLPMFVVLVGGIAPSSRSSDPEPDARLAYHRFSGRVVAFLRCGSDNCAALVPPPFRVTIPPEMGIVRAEVSLGVTYSATEGSPTVTMRVRRADGQTEVIRPSSYVLATSRLTSTTLTWVVPRIDAGVRRLRFVWHLGSRPRAHREMNAVVTEAVLAVTTVPI